MKSKKRLVDYTAPQLPQLSCLLTSPHPTPCALAHLTQTLAQDKMREGVNFCKG